MGDETPDSSINLSSNPFRGYSIVFLVNQYQKLVGMLSIYEVFPSIQVYCIFINIKETIFTEW